MKKRLLTLLICGVVLGLLFVSGLSCVSYDQGTTGDDWFLWDEEKFTEFITPDCPYIAGCLQDIDPTYEGDPPDRPTQDGFDAIRDWVAANIEYKTDEEQWGIEEYWQTPEETLSLRTGDCEDFAILLCTLLRAYGVSEEQIYVAVGIDDDGYGHAFLIENWYLDGEWRAIEPQAGAQTFPPGRRFKDYSLADFKLLRDYEIILGFNDSYYYDEYFPWDEN
ncbi:MAG TPA: transglutaminase-like cysteine peptidase [Dehalococcoidia bacterium]|nr:transglutaminase-like cysteine peptidase [Dehalococcoidia bacterium]